MNFASLVVVVIYEIELAESSTLNSLIKLRKNTPNFPEILMYDNSRHAKFDEQFSNYITYYQHDSANNGVGGAYNYAIDLACRVNKEWLILFDQDTDVSDNYFEQLFISINRFPQGNLFCPTVLSNNRILSPAYYFLHRAFTLKQPKPGLLKSRYFTVINSGLAIRLSELQKLGGYDSELLLDFSDHYFFSKYKKRNSNFVVMNCQNQHRLSANSDSTFEAAYKRFKKYAVSAIVYSRKVDSYFPRLWLCLRTLKLTSKFSKVEFIKYLLFKK
jgi:GT2 family glycosyltransferase